MIFEFDTFVAGQELTLHGSQYIPDFDGMMVALKGSKTGLAVVRSPQPFNTHINPFGTPEDMDRTAQEAGRLMLRYIGAA